MLIFPSIVILKYKMVRLIYVSSPSFSFHLHNIQKWRRPQIFICDIMLATKGNLDTNSWNLSFGLMVILQFYHKATNVTGFKYLNKIINRTKYVHCDCAMRGSFQNLKYLNLVMNNLGSFHAKGDIGQIERIQRREFRFISGNYSSREEDATRRLISLRLGFRRNFPS